MSDRWEERAEAAESRELILLKALVRIRDGEGKTCDEYDDCGHKACESSAAACIIAAAAIDKYQRSN